MCPGLARDLQAEQGMNATTALPRPGPHEALIADLDRDLEAIVRAHRLLVPLKLDLATFQRMLDVLIEDAR